VLIGASLAGVLGALGAIPVAGAVQVLVVDWLAHREGRGDKTTKKAAAVSDV
jgi:predicted PurR-regulated permease PerM